MMMSHRSQPRTSISARLVGRNAAGSKPAALSLTRENKGVAVCTPAIRPDLSPYVDGNIDLLLVALNQQCDAAARPRDLSLEVRHRGDPRSIDPQHHVPRLQPGGQRRTRDVFDDQPAAGVELLLLLGVERPDGNAELAAAVIILVARGLGRLVVQQHRLDIDLASLVIAPD